MLAGGEWMTRGGGGCILYRARSDKMLGERVTRFFKQSAEPFLSDCQ